MAGKKVRWEKVSDAFSHASLKICSENFFKVPVKPTLLFACHLIISAMMGCGGSGDNVTLIAPLSSPQGNLVVVGRYLADLEPLSSSCLNLVPSFGHEDIFISQDRQFLLADIHGSTKGEFYVITEEASGELFFDRTFELFGYGTFIDEVYGVSGAVDRIISGSFFGRSMQGVSEVYLVDPLSGFPCTMRHNIFATKI